MKKIGVYSVLAVSALGFLLGLSPLKAHATSTVKMTFDGSTYNGKGGDSLGGYATYPYYFDIKNAAGTTTQGVPLLCLSFQDTIQTGETWTANLDTIGSTGISLTALQQDEDAWIDSQVISAFNSNPTGNALKIEELQWAAWEVGDSGLNDSVLETKYHLTTTQVSAIDKDISGAQSFVATNSLTSDPKLFYAAYELYVPVPDSQKPWQDGTPQTFMGPVVPEPSSFILFGSGLLTAAGALYRRKRRTA
jgi:hypothetical protein